MLVQLEERWLADVGFGEGFRELLRLDEPGAQAQPGGTYRLTQDSEVWIYWLQDEEKEWQAQYRFTLQPRQLADFAEMCHYQQSSPESHFTQKRVCSLATPEGRVTLSNDRLIITRHGQRQERELVDPAEQAAVLRHFFGVELGTPLPTQI